MYFHETQLIRMLFDVSHCEKLFAVVVGQQRASVNSKCNDETLHLKMIRRVVWMDGAVHRYLQALEDSSDNICEKASFLTIRTISYIQETSQLFFLR